MRWRWRPGGESNKLQSRKIMISRTAPTSSIGVEVLMLRNVMTRELDVLTRITDRLPYGFGTVYNVAIAGTGVEVWFRGHQPGQDTTLVKGMLVAADLEPHTVRVSRGSCTFSVWRRASKTLEAHAALLVW